MMLLRNGIEKIPDVTKLSPSKDGLSFMFLDKISVTSIG
jgi:hypothetical protein